MSSNLDVGNDECIILLILLAVSWAVLKSCGRGVISLKRQEKPFLNRVSMLFLGRDWLLLYDLKPYLLSISGLNIKMEHVSFIPLFFRFSDPRRGKGTLCTFHHKKVNSGSRLRGFASFFSARDVVVGFLSNLSRSTNQEGLETDRKYGRQQPICVDNKTSEEVSKWVIPLMRYSNWMFCGAPWVRKLSSDISE